MTLPTLTLTARAVAIAALQAHAEGRLGYQRGHVFCRYRYPDGSVCAVGAALPDEYVPEECEGNAVWQLPTVRLADGDKGAIGQMQFLHDGLCSKCADGSEVNEAEFLELLRQHAVDAE